MQHAVLHLAGERADAPGGLVARRHHVGVAGEGDVRAFGADARIEVVDVGGAVLAEGHAVAGESGSAEGFFKHAKRTGIFRGYRGAADEIAGNREGIGHVPRLTCMPPGGLALGGTISIS